MCTVGTDQILEEDSAGVCPEPDTSKIKYKTLFVSDTHLGTKGFQSEKFIDFIDKHSFENIYIVGDFIDIWMLKKEILATISYKCYKKNIKEI